ncbi:hypothetical protein [Streptomyces sp. SID3212]|uniref:hypothetical protein n=1 Tax=Streptomyces sp. SID3212 TaxID=2690259 RepID=UPI00136AA1C3|nr:hypothetical protein [Streptomyces sp. SID3212]MYV53334.1 hypothetical protein [Streptomyces sp. SID3212]
MFRSTARSTTRSVRRSAVAAAGVAAVLGLALSATLPASAATATDPNNRYTAAEIRTFLQDFYGEQGPGPFARKYGISPYLAQRVKETEGFDLLLCAQNTPRSIDVGPATTAQSLGRGWATVTAHWGGSGASTTSFKAYVDLDATYTIQLLDVDCEPDS